MINLKLSMSSGVLFLNLTNVDVTIIVCGCCGGGGGAIQSFHSTSFLFY
jgi:hypothetical protein